MRNKQNNKTTEISEEFNWRNNLEVEKEHIKNLEPEEMAQIKIIN